eukprot:g75288.t1
MNSKRRSRSSSNKSRVFNLASRLTLSLKESSNPQKPRPASKNLLASFSGLKEDGISAIIQQQHITPSENRPTNTLQRDAVKARNLNIGKSTSDSPSVTNLLNTRVHVITPEDVEDVGRHVSPVESPSPLVFSPQHEKESGQNRNKGPTKRKTGKDFRSNSNEHILLKSPLKLQKTKEGVSPRNRPSSDTGSAPGSPFAASTAQLFEGQDKQAGQPSPTRQTPDKEGTTETFGVSLSPSKQKKCSPRNGVQKRQVLSVLCQSSEQKSPVNQVHTLWGHMYLNCQSSPSPTSPPPACLPESNSSAMSDDPSPLSSNFHLAKLPVRQLTVRPRPVSLPSPTGQFTSSPKNSGPSRSFPFKPRPSSASSPSGSTFAGFAAKQRSQKSLLSSTTPSPIEGGLEPLPEHSRLGDAADNTRPPGPERLALPRRILSPRDSNESLQSFPSNAQSPTSGDGGTPLPRLPNQPVTFAVPDNPSQAARNPPTRLISPSARQMAISPRSSNGSSKELESAGDGGLQRRGSFSNCSLSKSASSSPRAAQASHRLRIQVPNRGLQPSIVGYAQPRNSNPLPMSRGYSNNSQPLQRPASSSSALSSKQSFSFGGSQAGSQSQSGQMTPSDLCTPKDQGVSLKTDEEWAEERNIKRQRHLLTHRPPHRPPSDITPSPESTSQPTSRPSPLPQSFPDPHYFIFNVSNAAASQENVPQLSPMETMGELRKGLPHSPRKTTHSPRKQKERRTRIRVNPPRKNPFLKSPTTGTGKKEKRSSEFWIQEHSFFTQHFEAGKVLGKGSFGDVTICRHRFDGCLYVVKRTRAVGTGEMKIAELWREAQILAALQQGAQQCPHIARYYFSWFEDENVHMQLEYCSGGSMRQPDKRFSEQELLKICLDISKALAFLAQRGFCHLDVKPDNILASCQDGETIYKLCDFGLATQLKPGPQAVLEGDSRYLAPEGLEGQVERPELMDIFSLGLTLYELASGENLPNDSAAHSNMRNGVIPDLRHLSRRSFNLIRSMLHPVPSQRPYAKDIVEALLRPDT